MKKYTIILFVIFVAFATSCKTNKNIATVSKKTNDELVKEHLADALREMLYDNYDLAISSLNKCVEIDANNSAIYYEFAEIYTKKEEYNVAISYMKKANELSPDNIFYKYYLAKLYIKNYDIESSIPLFEEVILVTKSYTPFYELAHYYKYLHQYSDAIKTYNKLQEKEGITEFNTDQKLIVYDRNSDKTGYLEELIFIVDYFPYNVDYKTRLINYYLENDNIGEASKILSKDSNMQSAEYYSSFAQYYKDKNDYDSTYIYLKLAFEKDNNFHEGRYLLIDDSFFNSKNYPNSEIDTLYNLMMGKQENNYETSLMYATYLKQNNKPYTAIKVLEKTEYQDDFYFNLNETLVELYFATDNYVKLDTLSTFMIDLYPNMPEYFLYSGISNMMLNDYERAEQLLKAGIDLIYSDIYMLSRFNFYLSYLYSIKNDEFNAEKYYKEAIHITDTYITLKNEYALFLIKNNTQLAKAELLINSCLKEEEDNLDYLYTSAYYNYKIKKYEEAAIIIKELIEMSENENAKYYRLYYDILLSQNKKQEAKQQLEKANLLDRK